MTENEAFAILSLQPTTDKQIIKRHFRNISLKLHPDHGGDSEHYQKVLEAYEFLMSEQLSKLEQLIVAMVKQSTFFTKRTVINFLQDQSYKYVKEVKELEHMHDKHQIRIKKLKGVLSDIAIETLEDHQETLKAQVEFYKEKVHQVNELLYQARAIKWPDLEEEPESDFATLAKLFKQCGHSSTWTQPQ